jgi:hypothetical protein
MMLCYDSLTPRNLFLLQFLLLLSININVAFVADQESKSPCSINRSNG